MKRFQKFIGKGLSLERVKEFDRLKVFGIECTYLPDPLEDIDELEFRSDFNGKDKVVITVATELGQIKRIIFGMADEKNPDVIRSLERYQLEDFLSRKEPQLIKFFEHITDD